MNRERRSSKSKVIVIFGDSGVGKSTAAREFTLQQAGGDAEQVFKELLFSSCKRDGGKPRKH